ncbi:MAG: DUF368 domain-containing protein [Lachnospiraceae bacterium]|nr:DUF368 domain-containing protein [Lachnospiraceae bacterium]
MLKNICKGMLIGIANIIPGVSGGTMAVSMGIYDRLIRCISHPFKDLKNNILFLLPIALGMGIAIIASAFGIDYLFESFPVQTNLLFIGLIMGSLPTIYGKVKMVTMRLGHMLAAVLFFAVVVGMAALNGSRGSYVKLEPTVTGIILLFLVGVLASATMVIPGVSGSMMLLLLGYYNPILDMIKNFFIAVLAVDFSMLFHTILILAPFGTGVLVGMVVIAKMIEVVFDRYPTHAYWAIIGLLFGSPIAILMVGTFYEINFVGIVTGVMALLCGLLISNKLGEK